MTPPGFAAKMAGRLSMGRQNGILVLAIKPENSSMKEQ
jgi:hypothetical protein